jgi:galactose mutarotase-like enzyme
MTLENDFLRLKVNEKGAEMQSLVDKQQNRELLWQGNPEYWNRKAPVLFPIVGKLKGNSYIFEEKAYQLPQHGFARDCTFSLLEKTNSLLCFSLKSSSEKKVYYPFDFELIISYALMENKLICTYKVKNSGSQNMFFSIGAHPGFALPIDEDNPFESYQIRFEKVENLNRFLLTEGLQNGEIEKVNLENSVLKLNYKLFEKDAIVLKNMQSSWINLEEKNGNRLLKFHAENFPFYGIWTKKNAPFVCLEPWHGIADSHDSNQQFQQKEGIISLVKNQVFSCSFAIEV